MLYKYKVILSGLTGGLFLLLLTFSQALAQDSYFDIGFDRCVSIDTVEGNKRISDLGDSVILNNKGRLWLTGNETQDGFVEILCQNLSSEAITVELTSKEMPWISITGPEECNTWNNNLLICPVGEMAKGVFCKINERSVVAAGDGARKQTSTSVNVRAVDLKEDRDEGMNELQYLQERIDYYSAGIDLCYTIYERSGDIILNWVIYGGGVADQVTIDSKTAPEDQEVANCIAEQIPQWKFPEWEKDSQVSYQF